MKIQIDAGAHKGSSLVRWPFWPGWFAAAKPHSGSFSPLKTTFRSEIGPGFLFGAGVRQLNPLISQWF